MLATGLAHEIKSPLAALLTATHPAQDVKDKQDAGAKLEKSLQNVVESTTWCD